MKTTLVIILFVLLMSVSAFATGLPVDTAAIQRICGVVGALNTAEGVFKISVPRTDVAVSVDGWRLPPFMGLTSWAAFEKGTTEEAMVMGDLVLFQDEVNPVMSTLLDHSISVTALHNHFFYDEPKVYYMHIDADGAVDTLARGVRAALDKVKEIRSRQSIPSVGSGARMPDSSRIDDKAIRDVLGSMGKISTKDGMCKAVIGRTAKVSCGCTVGSEMGLNTWAAFAGTQKNALVDGDFAVHENELQAVLKSLRRSGIQVVAIHHHMIEEEPRVIFLHYWGHGRAEELASAVKSALEMCQDKP